MLLKKLFELSNPRYERKFIIESHSIEEVRSMIRYHPASFFEAYPERRVNNIYFDTPLLKHYLDNVAGNTERMKVRIRWYGRSDMSIKKPFLELKIKRGLAGGKILYPLNGFKLPAAGSDLFWQDIFRNSCIDPLISEYLTHLSPVLINSYSRGYYESADHKFRVTLDYGLGYCNPRQIQNFLEGIIDECRTIIMEIKYSPGDEEAAGGITNKFPFRITKNSKYAEGVDILYPHCSVDA